MEPVLVKPKRIPIPAEVNFKPDEEEPAPAEADKALASKAFDLIRGYEGVKLEPYRDTKAKWTVGIGTLIGAGTDADYKASPFYKKQLDLPTAKALATKEISKKITLIKDLVGPETFNNFSPDLQAHLVSGAYRGDITGSPKALKLLSQQDFTGAAQEFLDNKEYRKAKAEKSGVAKRMADMAEIIRNEKPLSFQGAVENRFNQLSSAK